MQKHEMVGEEKPVNDRQDVYLKRQKRKYTQEIFEYIKREASPHNPSDFFRVVRSQALPGVPAKSQISWGGSEFALLT